MSNALLVILTARLKPGEFERLAPSVPYFVDASRNEPGCLSFDFYRSITDGDVVTTMERWDGPMATIAHLCAIHTRSFMSLLQDCVAQPFTFTTVPDTTRPGGSYAPASDWRATKRSSQWMV